WCARRIVSVRAAYTIRIPYSFRRVVSPFPTKHDYTENSAWLPNPEKAVSRARGSSDHKHHLPCRARLENFLVCARGFGQRQLFAHHGSQRAEAARECPLLLRA